MIGDLEISAPARRAFVIAGTRALSRIPSATRERGREYADEGRVSRVTATEDTISAIVTGSIPYTVVVQRRDDATLTASCECPASEHAPGVARASCKHVAALLVSLGARMPPPEEGMTRGGRVHPTTMGWSGEHARAALPPGAEPLADLPAAPTVLRLSVYAREPLELPASPWRPFAEHLVGAGSIDPRLGAAVARHGAELVSVVEALRAWEPPPNPAPGVSFGAFYERLAARYRDLAPRLAPSELGAGPLDDRHPGWTYRYLPASRGLTVREKRAFEHGAQPALEVTVPQTDDDPMNVYGPSMSSHRGGCVWVAFATRALLLELASPADPVIAKLALDMSRPVWEQVLARLSAPAARSAPGQAQELVFVLSSHGVGAFAVRPHARGITGDRRTKWREVSLQAVAEGAMSASAEERRIARLALSSSLATRPGYVEVASPLGYELLGMLAEHPAVSALVPYPEQSAPFERPRVLVGDLRMTIDPAPNGTLRPSFTVGGQEIPRAVWEDAKDVGESGWWGHADEGLFASILVPRELSPWLQASLASPASVSFPPEAAKALLERVQPLVARGLVETPRETLGAELAAAYQVGLRVEWRPDGTCLLEAFASPHPAAPLVDPGLGPDLYTFQDKGRRVFVERDKRLEIQLVERALSAMPDVLVWDPTEPRRLRTESIADTLALVEHVRAADPPLRIETKSGVMPWASVFGGSGSIAVRRSDHWFEIRGDARVGDRTITLGEILDAARMAHGYAPLGDGGFLHVPEAIREKLAAFGAAVQLGDVTVPRDASGESVRVHDAFADALLGLEEVFADCDGFDVRGYLAARTKEPPPEPTIERGELRPYQVEGARWMLGLARWARGCILADDMGLGKTVQTAAVLLARAELGPALVVAPASVASNWTAELARFAPSLRVVWVTSGDGLARAPRGPRDVVVISYGLVARAVDAFEDAELATLVLDEAQYLKNHGAQRTRAARRIPRRFTIALTGTPLENHLGDLHSLMDQTNPGLLGTADSFRTSFREPIEADRNHPLLAGLVRMIAPFILRRTRKEVLSELPPRQDVTQLVELSKEEARRYAALRRACELALLASKRERRRDADTRLELLAAITRLRQMASDVALVDPEWKHGSSKLDVATDLCVSLAREGNRALVFSQFIGLLEGAARRLREAGLRVVVLTGQTPATERAELIASFQRGEHDVFCISLKAGGTGINLTHANYVVHVDPWWNPAVEEQATARAHRMGQREPVTVYRLVSRGTIEEAILELHARKRDLANAILDGTSGAGGAGTAGGLDDDELLDLVRFAPTS